jgi:peptidyl-prolyl cis-trans isomerase C
MNHGNAPPSRLRRLLREPLLHFLLIGGAFFVVYHFRHPADNAGANGRRVEITDDDIRQMDVNWMGQWRRHPTPEEWRGLIESRIREEILYREALAMGLDQGDTIVKRRMGQKMEFLFEDLSRLRDPTVEELRTWYPTHADGFTLPTRVTFRHLYFSPDKRGGNAKSAAAAALAKLAGSKEDDPAAASLADQFMFQDYYVDRTFEEVASAFGTPFAEALVKLKPGDWKGPLESGLGWHLVWVDSITPGRVPTFDEVDPAQIKAEWQAAERAAIKRRALEEMKSRYQIVMPKSKLPFNSNTVVAAGPKTK